MCKGITTSDSVVTDSKTMPLIAENAEVTGEEHPEQSTMNDDAATRRRQMKLVRGIVDVLYSAQ